MPLAFWLERLIFLEHHFSLLPSGFLSILVNGGIREEVEDGRRVSSPPTRAWELTASIDIKSQNPLQHSPFCLVLALSSGNIPSLPFSGLCCWLMTPHGPKPWGPALNISGVFPYPYMNRCFIKVSLTTCWSVSPSFIPSRALMNADSSRADMGYDLDGLSLDRWTGD